MKRILTRCIVCLSVLAAFCCCNSATTPQDPDYAASLEEAIKLSEQSGRLIFVNCYADWARPSVAMDSLVIRDARFSRWLSKHFVCLKMDKRDEANRDFFRRYGIDTFACYLFLDAQGNLVHRIEGGAKTDEFKRMVELALHDATTMKGARERYNAGPVTDDVAYNYARALRHAGEDSLFVVIGREYLNRLTPHHYADKRNWIVYPLVRNIDDEHYRYLINNKSTFVKRQGEDEVNKYIESVLCRPLQRMATGSMPITDEEMEKYNREIQLARLPDTLATVVMYNMAKLRGEKRYTELLNYADSMGWVLQKYPGIRVSTELTFRFNDMTDADKQTFADYMARAIKREEGRRAASQLQELLDELTSDGNDGNTEQGIAFEKKFSSLDDLLQKAKNEHKLVFIDCYTVWCGPCRVMSKQVFTREEVGSFVNQHFISAKIDMEAPLGTALAKRYDVKAYPTMIVLDTDGTPLTSIIGSRSPENFLTDLKKGLKLKAD